ncbi:MAG: alginate lyase family protein, partial [Thermodesulfobacteriota bacterium]
MLAADLAAAAAPHPSLLLDQREIDELRTVLASEDPPRHLVEAYRATLDGAPRGADVATRFSPAIYTSDWHDRYRAALEDGTRASDAALAWALTGDVEYAEAARTILLAWTRATVGGGRQHGVADMGFVGLAWAYDLIHGVLDATDRGIIEDWLLRVAAPLHDGWHPNGPTAEYYVDHYGHAAYQNEFAWLNLLYGAVGFVTGDRERIEWATAQQWPYDDFGHHPELRGANARSLREFIRGAIYRDSTATVRQSTRAFFAGLLDVPEFLFGLVPDGSMYDYWHRGPSPLAGGKGQGYQLFTLQAMALLAEMAWHAGDDVFSWRAPNGNRLKDGTDFARPFAAHANHPLEDAGMTFLYELIYSHHADPADLALLESSGRRNDPSGHFMRHKFPLVGYARRTSGAPETGPRPTPAPPPGDEDGGPQPTSAW